MLFNGFGKGSIGAMWSRNTIQAVKNAADITKVVESHGIELKRSGVSEVGLCPFHEENSPSFNVNASTRTYHCFGCGEGGDVIDFVMNMDGMTFAESIESLADQFSVPLPDEESDESGDNDNEMSRKDMFQVLSDAADAFSTSFESLPPSHPAKEMIESRGVAGMDDFGYGGDDAIEHINRLHSKRVLSLLGFLSEKGNHLFRGRLIFPIRDVMGRCIGFSARRLGEGFGGKYVNTSASPLYDKSKSFYGFDKARKSRKKECFIVEGQMDVCSLRASGIDNVVASCGTAITQEHVDILLRRFDRIVFFLDPDEAGLKACAHALKMKGVALHGDAVVNKFGNMDPNDILVHEGDVALAEMCQQKHPSFVDAVLSPLLPTGSDPTVDARNEERLREIVGGIADDEVRFAWMKFINKRFSGDISVRQRQDKAVDSGPEPDFVSLVANKTEQVFNVMRDNVEFFQSAVDDNDIEDGDALMLVIGIITDDDFVSHVAEYIDKDVRSHVSNPLWKFLDGDGLLAVIKSLLGISSK